ncbi:MAG: hypothetical protein JW779_01465 [Candidatus Thorarchaeota archaeon]|nr:hypothetical protein [Candidatus Thorarchaeota archaeon]
MGDLKREPSGGPAVTKSLESDLIEPVFQSLTTRFLTSSISKNLKCPNCGVAINFQNGTEWIGPDSFCCNSCKKLVNITLIHKALRDLGV